MAVAISGLTSVDTVADGDLFPLFSQSMGGTAAAAASTFAAYLQGKITSTDNKVTQYFAPSATGWNVIVNGASAVDDSSSVWLILTPTAGFAAGTITLPPSLYCVDKQEIIVNCTQIVTTLTIVGNGASVSGAPTTLTAGASFRLRFDGVTQTWYKV
jgi:hypothetical protein